MGAAAAALTLTAGGVAQAAPATAQASAADVTVTMATASVIAVGTGATLTTTVKNKGGSPASGVALQITLPPGFDVWETSTSSNLPCDQTGQVVTCEGGPDLAAHTAEYPVTLALSSFSLPPGTIAHFAANVTTTSPESNTSNNAASRTVKVVGVGTVQGNVWNDLNGNGQREPGEPPLNDITSVQVINPKDGGGQDYVNIFDGFYSFEGVRAIKNIVRVTLSGTGPWTFTTPNVGDDATDSDVGTVSATPSEITGESAAFRVTAGGVVTVDVGLVAKSQ